MTLKIVVVGSANTDMVVQVSEVPKIGETVLGGKFILAQGGKGANQAVAAARLGAEVSFVACLGRDDLGQTSVDAYRAEGILTDYIVRNKNEPSGVALILVNQRGENIIAVAPGANRRLTPKDIYNAEDAIQAADALLVQLEIPLNVVETAVQVAKKHGVKVILNPAPAIPLTHNLLNHVDYMTPNENEFAQLAGISIIENQSLSNYIEKISLQALIVTLGARGALVVSNGSVQHVPGYKVEAIDTVAAGDAFNGAFCVAISRGVDLIDAVHFANAAAAISVTRVGAQPSLPTLDEVQKFVNHNY